MLVGWSEAEWFLRSHKWELHGRFLDLVEPHLENTLRDWEQAVEEQAQEIDDEDARDRFYDFHSDEYHERLEFKSIQRGRVRSSAGRPGTRFQAI